jgi:hypothetical protein
MKPQKRRRNSSKKSSTQSEKKAKAELSKSTTDLDEVTSVTNLSKKSSPTDPDDKMASIVGGLNIETSEKQLVTSREENSISTTNPGPMSLMEEMVRKVMGEMMENFTQTLKSELSDIKKNLEWSDVRFDEIEKECREYKSKTLHLEDKLASLSKELSLEKSKRIDLELEQKKRNLIIFGIKEQEDESDTKQTAQRWIQECLNIESCNIDTCYRIGRRVVGKKLSRPIKICFETYSDRTTVWKSKRLLKGTSAYIKEDLPEETEKELATLMPVFNAAKAAGHKCSLNRNRLHIDGELYSCETLDRLPESLKLSTIATKNTDKEIFFWGCHTPLSNMYKCSIAEEGVVYNSVEQMYVTQKARFFGDKNAENKALHTSDPILQKKISIRGFNRKEWEVVAEEHMHKCIKAKFTQNPELRNILINSYPKILAEASPHDALWGIGMGMHNPLLVDKSKWGRNLTGKILMKVRDTLRVDHS